MLCSGTRKADNQIDIALVTETFLNKNHSFHLPNYLIYRNDRTSHGGGVLITKRNKITHELLPKRNTSSIEAISIFINGCRIILTSAYCLDIPLHF